MKDTSALLDGILNGSSLDKEAALEIAGTYSLEELCSAADQARRHFHGNSLDLCSIVNARSGRCTENCRFCAQSAHHPVDVETYDCVDLDKAVAMARENESFGVERFSLVTAGRTVSEKQLAVFSSFYHRLADETAMSFCASMGFLTPQKAASLKRMGVRRYHCNLEAARSFFPQVCTSHSWEEKVETIHIAKEAGLEICSGGIIGMGETLRQRVELAIELRELEVYSIPVNILTPIPNTPLAELKPLSAEEILTAIALFRLINPRAVIRLAGGRNQLGNRQYQCFQAGANGAIVGNYLTTAGNSLAEDVSMFRRLGFNVKSKMLGESGQ